jgi:iron complex outermembrane receptor protein
VGAGAVSLQTYVDHTLRDIPQVFKEIRDTYDVAAQHQFPFLRIHRFTYGGGFRLTQDAVGNTLGTRFEPDHATDRITNVFAQDDVQVTPAWTANVGAKYERNDYTGWEFQPSVRTGWQFVKNHYLWASVSQAVRTPTRLDADVKLQSVIAAAPPTLLSAQGSDDFVSERLTAYEAGYRGQPFERLLFSVSTFFNKYNHLRSANFETPYLESDPSPAHAVVPLVINNDLWGETYGAETTQRVKIFPWWEMWGSYSYLHQRLHARGEDPASVAASGEISDPVHQFAVRSSWNAGPKLEFDAGVRWVDAIADHAIDDYAAVDARAAYKASPSLTFEVDGQNLTEPTHREFTGGEEVQRSVFGKAIWRMR